MNGLGIVVTIAVVVSTFAIWLALRETPARGKHEAGPNRPSLDIEAPIPGVLPTTSSGRDPHAQPLVGDHEAAPTQRNGNGEDLDK